MKQKLTKTAALLFAFLKPVVFQAQETKKSFQSKLI
jgi:hypothetical protein